jgi:hypothetical protein
MTMNQLGLPLALIALTSTLAGCAAPTADGQEESSLITLSWAAEPGEQAQHCARLRVDERIDITAIEALTPQGTQRLTVWYADASDAFDGCPDVDARGLLFDGLDPLELPSAVALRVPAGKELWLRADIVNDTQAPLHGTSGIWLDTTGDANVIADVVSLSADIAGGDACKMPEDTFLFAVAPDVVSDAHMLLTAHSSFAGGDVMLFDDGATVGARALAQPVALRAGESVEASCVSASGVFSSAAVGDSPSDCAVAVYRFPAASVGCQ